MGVQPFFDSTIRIGAPQFLHRVLNLRVIKTTFLRNFYDFVQSFLPASTSLGIYWGCHIHASCRILCEMSTSLTNTSVLHHCKNGLYSVNHLLIFFVIIFFVIIFFIIIFFVVIFFPLSALSFSVYIVNKCIVMKRFHNLFRNYFPIQNASHFLISSFILCLYSQIPNYLMDTMSNLNYLVSVSSHS